MNSIKPFEFGLIENNIFTNNLWRDKIYVIIVLYFPDIEQLNKLIEILQKSSKNVVFVDNTPEKINENLKNISRRGSSSVHYIPLKENKGIAEAQNIGIRYAQNIDGIDYLLFFDQDSVVSDTFISQMLCEYIRISNLGVKISALGPTPINKDTNTAYKRERFNHNELGGGYRTPLVLISSGMLIAMSTINDVGLMESKLFIDTVDFEWCWRAKTKEYVCCMTEKVTILHKVGIQDKSFFGYSILVSSPIRYYYQYRNFILLLKRSYVPLNWKLKGIIKKIFFLVYIPMMTKNGMRSFKNMVKGIKSGVLNK